MPSRTTIITTARLCAALAAGALALGDAFAIAQTVEELTVTGRPPKGPPETFSYRVSYADLDLRSEAGRKDLNRRIQITAAYVCKKVDEPDDACRAEAIASARAQTRAATHQARAHGAKQRSGPPWVPPHD